MGFGKHTKSSKSVNTRDFQRHVNMSTPPLQEIRGEGNESSIIPSLQNPDPKLI